ncbi:MAG: DNA/RNA nuclease SfsA, partial [Gammaproteobacteria bacterium]|nr:DNA/RNA nuclease SfsA [Gammaproteobacteria bacterium]
MIITAPYKEGKLVRRYKRFLADIELPDGEILTVHTPNTGSMLGCAEPGSRVWIYKSNNPKRKYAYSWELVEDLQGNLIGIHTGRVNALVSEAIANKTIGELSAYTNIQQEKKYKDTSTRFDLLLTGDNVVDCYVEIKNVTARENNIAIFPDAVSERGRKHLEVLQDVVKQGLRAVMFYCIQRED